jgi:hypothetical protein
MIELRQLQLTGGTMTVQTLKIGKERLVVLRERDYKMLLRHLERDRAQDARDVAEAQRRLRDPRRKTIPLSQLKAQLGLWGQASVIE